MNEEEKQNMFEQAIKKYRVPPGTRGQTARIKTLQVVVKKYFGVIAIRLDDLNNSARHDDKVHFNKFKFLIEILISDKKNAYLNTFKMDFGYQLDKQQQNELKR